MRVSSAPKIFVSKSVLGLKEYFLSSTVILFSESTNFFIRCSPSFSRSSYVPIKELYKAICFSSSVSSVVAVSKSSPSSLPESEEHDNVIEENIKTAAKSAIILPKFFIGNLLLFECFSGIFKVTSKNQRF